MKIAFIIQDVTTDGGTERTTCCLANEMVRQGNDVTIVSVFHEQEPCFPIDYRVKLEYLTDEHYGLDLNFFERLCLVFRQVGAVKRCEALQNADVIISQKLLASVLVNMAGLTSRAYACEHYKYGMYNPVVRFFRDRMYRGFHGLVTLTDNDRQQFLARGVQHVHVVENMVSITPLPYEGYNAKTILAVGRLDKQKAFDLLLEAISYIPAEKMEGWHVDIYGDGPDREMLVDLRDELDLNDRVAFHPFVKNIEQAYATHAMLVMSSRFEGFPMVLLEAAAAGIPIISFACKEGPATLLSNGGGILVEPENTKALAEAIVRVMEDSALRMKLRSESKQVVVNYTPEAIYRKWMTIISKVNE